MTVDAILRATELVLIDQGLGGATTNAIAKVAGVSIGTLYQYFPNKDALVAAVFDRRLAEMAHSLRTESESPTASAKGLVQAALGPLQAEHELFVQLLPLRLEAPFVERWRMHVRDSGELFAQLLRRTGQAERAPAASWLLAEGLCAALCEAMRQGRLDALFYEELTHLLRAYLVLPLAPTPFAVHERWRRHLECFLGVDGAARALELAGMPAGAEGEEALAKMRSILVTFLGAARASELLEQLRAEQEGSQ